MGKSRLLIKEPGILAGVEIARKIFHRFDPDLKMTVYIEDGTAVKPGDVAFCGRRTRTIIIANRASYAQCDAAHERYRYDDSPVCEKNSKVCILAFSIPARQLRACVCSKKEAVKIGGGVNHRIGLFDMILLKDNHVDFAGGIENAISRCHDYLKAKGKDLKIEIEVRNLDELKEVMRVGGVDRIMLDNFSPELTKEAVKIVGGKYEIESSGGITFDTIRDYAESGVDFVSVGALTHSVKGLDMSFKAC